MVRKGKSLPSPSSCLISPHLAFGVFLASCSCTSVCFFISANVTFAEYEPFFEVPSPSSRLPVDEPSSAPSPPHMEPFPFVEPLALNPPSSLPDRSQLDSMSHPAPSPEMSSEFSFPSSDLRPPDELSSSPPAESCFPSEVPPPPSELSSSPPGELSYPPEIPFPSPGQLSFCPPGESTSPSITSSHPLSGGPSHPSSDVDDDHLGWPIALQKGVHSCTRTPLYPLSHYLSFYRLSTPYRLFLTRIELDPIPRRLADAIASPHWRAAMDEEM